MTTERNSSDKVWLSLAFYVAYFTYFMSYAYEINYMVTYKCSYVLFFSLLACSFISVLFASSFFMVVSMLLVCAKMFLEWYVFIVFLQILRRPHLEMIRWFYFLRVVVSILFLFLFWQYMKHIISEKKKKLEEMREIEEHVQSYNDKIQEDERNQNIVVTPPPPVSVIPPNTQKQETTVPQVYYDPNQINMTNGHYYQVPMNNHNMMYNPNMGYNQNRMNMQPVPLPIPSTTATMTVNANQNQNQNQMNGSRTAYPYTGQNDHVANSSHY